jgi:hypothetical protein
MKHTNTHWVSMDEDAHFGTFPCDCCDSRLAGDRFDAVQMGWNESANKLEQIECGTICVDCLMKTA